MRWLCPQCVVKIPRAESSDPPPPSPQGGTGEYDLVGEPDTHDHARYRCEDNKELRRFITDFSDPTQEVTFFRRIIERRNNLGL